MSLIHLTHHSPIPRKGVYINSVKLLLVLGKQLFIKHISGKCVNNEYEKKKTMIGCYINDKSI